MLIVGWLAVWAISILGEYSDNASFWFPPAGLSFAVLLIVGIRAAPLIIISALIATYWSSLLHGPALTLTQILEAGLVFGVAHIVPYYLGARLLQFVADSTEHSLPRSIIAFLIIAAFFSLLATATVISGLVATDMMSAEEIVDNWLPFWIGDMVALMVLAPLFAGLLLRLYPRPRFWLEDLEIRVSDLPLRYFIFKLLASALFLGGSMLLASHFRVLESAFIIFFLIIPQMWITYSESPFRTAVSLGVFSFLIVSLVHLFGLNDYLMVYQFAISVVSASAYFGLAVPTLIADNHQLREKVMKDSLTRTASREFFLEQIGLELQRFARGDGVISLLVVDVDHFKDINDQFGHVTGDKALISLSEAAREVLRGFDTLGRFGGDEFVALLPNTGVEHAELIAERMLARIRKIKLSEDRYLTASIGVTQCQPDDDFQTLFDRADIALYRAKETGRDRVCVADGS